MMWRSLPGVMWATVLLVGCTPSDLNEPGQLPTAPLTIGDDEVLVEVARTESEVRAGLMGRAVESLPSGRGMFFVFPGPQQPGFFNRDVPFAIDVAFIRRDQTIARIVQLQADDPSLAFPGEPIQYVLETVAGDLASRGIQEGDSVIFSSQLVGLINGQ